MGSDFGALRIAAKRAGLTVDQYLARLNSGLKYCWRCRSWRDRSEFGLDATRSDKKAATCTSCRKPPKQLAMKLHTQADKQRLRYASDAEYRAIVKQRVHARKRSIAPMPLVAIDALTERFEGLCAYCPQPATTWDHMVPVSKGGRTEPGNMVPACVSCNSRKRDMDLHDFIVKYDIPITMRLESALSLALSWGQLDI